MTTPRNGTTPEEARDEWAESPEHGTVEQTGLGQAGPEDGTAIGPPIGWPRDEEELSLASLLESLLFVAAEPATAEQLAQALARSVAEVEAGLDALQRAYQEERRGIRLQRRNHHVQMVTAPAAAGTIEAFLSLDLSIRMSGPALETLAIVAYRQPVARAQIEAVRGVDCSGVLRNLQQHGLIEEVGRMETVGRPILYGVTDLFLQHFGITDLADLPPLPNEDADALHAAITLAEEGSARPGGG